MTPELTNAEIARVALADTAALTAMSLNTKLIGIIAKTKQVSDIYRAMIGAAQETTG